MEFDGFSLDDKRTKTPEQNDVPDIIAKWRSRDKKQAPGKGEKWFWVDVADIRDNKYDLSISRYKPVEYEEVEYDSPKAILAKAIALENEINAELETIKHNL